MNDSVMSGNFLEPSTSKGLKGFHLYKRKRKIADLFNSTSTLNSPGEMLNSSTVSDMFTVPSSANASMMMDTSVAAPDVKRKRSLSRMTSVISTPMAKMSSALQRSISSARLHTGPNCKGTPTRFLRSTTSVSTIIDESIVGNCGSPALKRGTSTRNSASKLTPYKPPQPTPNKQRPTRYWSESYPDTAQRLRNPEVKLQEAIYELSCGEEDLMKDLQMIIKNYGDPLCQLQILTSVEADMVFGKLRPIIPLHSDLHRALESRRCASNGLCGPVGQVVYNWVDRVQLPYVEYCSSLIRVKAFLDHKRETNKSFSDFLQRCLESGFSRKLDLWSYLDVPRSKLVKYPLLLRQIVKYCTASTPAWPDTELQLLNMAITKMEVILEKVDTCMAEAKCQFTVSRLEWIDEAVELRSHAVRKAREEILDGVLRSNRGTKLECHLLDTVLILGRPSSRMSTLATVPSTVSLMSSSSTSSLMSTSSAASYQQQHQQLNGHNNHSHSPTSSHHSASSDGSVYCGKRLQVYRTPIPVEEMVLEDLNPVQSQGNSFSETSSNIPAAVLNSSVMHNSGAKAGSFRQAFASSSNTGNKNGFRVSFRRPSDGQSHTLIAPDEHSKRQWMAALRKTMQRYQPQSHPMNGLHSVNDSSTDPTSSEYLSLPKLINGNSVCETDFSSSCNINSPKQNGSAKRIYAPEGKISKNPLTPIKTGLFQKHKRSPRIRTALSQTALESVKSGAAAKEIRCSASARKLPAVHDENFHARVSVSSSMLTHLDTSNLVVLSALAASKNRSRRPSSLTPSALTPPPPPLPPRNRPTIEVSRVNSLPLEELPTPMLRRQPASNGSLVAAAVGKRILKQQLKAQNSSRTELKPGIAFRSRTKSWGALGQHGAMGNASYHGDTFDVDGMGRRYNTRSVSKKVSKSMSDLHQL